MSRRHGAQVTAWESPAGSMLVFATSARPSGLMLSSLSSSTARRIAESRLASASAAPCLFASLSSRQASTLNGGSSDAAPKTAIDAAGSRGPAQANLPPPPSPPPLLRGGAHDVFGAGDRVAHGRYRLDAKLHDGRFTTVWRATDLARQQPVVVKLSEAGDADARAAGLSEAAAHAAAAAGATAGDTSTNSNSNHVLPLLDVIEERSAAGRHVGIVTPPLGASLADALAAAAGGARMGLPLPAVRALACQTLEGLDQLHRSARVVHLSIAPENLLLDRPFVSAAAPPPPPPPLHIAAAGALRGALGGAWAALSGGGGSAAASSSSQSTPPPPPLPPYSELDLDAAALVIADFGRAVQLPPSFPAVPPPPRGLTAPRRRLLRPWTWLRRGGGAVQLDFYSSPPLWPAVPLADYPARFGDGDANNAASSSSSVFPDAEPPVIFAPPGRRPPEEVLGLEYRGPAFDLYSTGLLVFALATGHDLFAPPAAGGALPGGEGDVNDAHLADLVGVLGRPPPELVAASPLRRRYFARASRRHHHHHRGGLGSVAATAEEAVAAPRLHLESRYLIADQPLEGILRDEHGLGAEDAEQLAAFLGRLLAWDPRARPSAAAMLAHPWLAGGGKRDGEREREHGGVGGVDDERGAGGGGT